MLTPRRETILRLVTETYIETAHPVPSSAIAEPLELSSATVRSELAALEEMGYLQQPHTSAGRVPTARGYRRYARDFIPPRALPARLRRALRAQLAGVHGDALVRAIARTSSDLSGYAVVVTLPADTELRIREIHLSLLSSRRLLAVVVLENGLVRQLGVDLDPTPDDDVLDAAERRLRRIARSLGDLEAALRDMAALEADGELARTLGALADAWPDLHPPLVVGDGLRNLLGEPEARDPDFIRLAVDRFERGALGAEAGASGTAADARSGEDANDAARATLRPHGALGLRLDEAVAQVSAHLPLGGGRAGGTLTLIGPARMRYPAALMVARGVADLAAARVEGGGEA